jgi:hypothetical protein
MKSKIPASLDGVLEKIQTTFIDLERQEKRALSFIRKREDEITERRQVEGEEDTVRTLKESEILDALNNKALDIINTNNKLKIELVKFYGTTIMSQRTAVEDVSENETSDDVILTEKDLEFLRGQALKNNLLLNAD